VQPVSLAHHSLRRYSKNMTLATQRLRILSKHIVSNLAGIATSIYSNIR
jgi:hypothetical protein